MNNKLKGLGHHDFHHNRLKSIDEVVPEYTNNVQTYNQVYYSNINLTNSNKSGFDKAGLGLNIFSIYYLFSIYSIYTSIGLDKFVEEYLSDPEYSEMVKNPVMMGISLNWIIIFCSFLGIIFGILGRNRNKNKLNLYNIISNSVVLVLGIISAIYAINYFNK